MLGPVSGVVMSNPTHCVVCQAELVECLAARPAEAPDVAEEGRFQTWDDTRFVAQIYCPRCQLLYRVVDPQERS